MPVLLKQRGTLGLLGWVWWVGCTATTGSAPEPTAEAPANEAVPTDVPAGPTETSAAVPLELSVWIDAPGKLASVEGIAMVGVGADLLIERDGALVQDGVVATVPNCADAGDVIDVAGTWPNDAVMLRGSGRLYRWDKTGWVAKGSAGGRTPALATVAGRPVLASIVDGALVLRWFDGKTRRSPTPDPACGTAIAELAGVRGNARGDLVAWGRGCSGDAVLERFGAGEPRSEVMRWSGAAISSAEFDRSGDVMVALARTEGEALVRRGTAWQTLGRVPGRIEGLADMGADGVLALVRRDVATIVRLGSPVVERGLPADAGEPVALRGGADGSLFVTTTTSSLRSGSPAFAWTLVRVGCDVATVRGAKAWAYRDRRPRAWTCAGGLFVLLASSRDRAAPPVGWRKLYDDMRAHVELGFQEARRRRGLPEPPRGPGAPMTPVVAYELGDVHFGFAVEGNPEIAENHLSDMNTAMTRLGLGSPRAICADPPGLPEAEVRRLAALTNTSAD